MSAVMPLDTLALLQLNGIRTDEWPVLKNYGLGNKESSDGNVDGNKESSDGNVEDTKVQEAAGMQETCGISQDSSAHKPSDSAIHGSV